MFSGIVEETGEVVRLTRRGRMARLEIRATLVQEGTKIGQSIAVNGACLTVVAIDQAVLAFEVMPETLKLTNLGSVRPADKVNLERALQVGSRISGHFVLGHVDTTGVIRKKYFKEGNLCFEVSFPQEFSSYVIPKGSLAIDGISLTIAAKKSASLSVYIIPHTLEHTTLGAKGPSSVVNLEFDILAKKSAPQFLQ